jgi:hypothetical protein
VFSDSSYRAEYLTAHRDFYLRVEQVVFFLFGCKQWGPHPPKEHSSGGGFLLSRVLFLVILLVVYVFVVYISLRDGRR